MEPHKPKGASVGGLFRLANVCHSAAVRGNGHWRAGREDANDP
jgi:hypothetical protein